MVAQDTLVVGKPPGDSVQIATAWKACSRNEFSGVLRED
jgi:hypothetical protein